jgi:hypothetical protein
MALVQALPQEFTQRIGPAVAQRAKEFAPLVWNAAKQGVKEGAKAGVKSLLRPSAKSKYSSFNSITNLANPPDGNIQAIIDANLEEAQARSGRKTAFLDAVIGSNRVNKLQKSFQDRSRSPSPSLSPRSYLAPIGIQGWQHSQDASRFRNLAKSRSPSPIAIQNPTLLTNDQISSIKERVESGELPASVLKNRNNLTNAEKEELKELGLYKAPKVNKNLMGGRRKTRRLRKRSTSRSRSSRRRH